jgi:hypothetical protein
VQDKSDQFVHRLESWRLELGLNHSQFAARLQLPKSHWSLIRRGIRRVPRSLARRVLQERPEFAYFLVADLTADGTERTEALAIAV